MPAHTSRRLEVEGVAVPEQGLQAPLLLAAPTALVWGHTLLSSLWVPNTSARISHLLGKTTKYHTFFLAEVSCFSGSACLKKSCPSLKQHFFELRAVPPFLSPLWSFLIQQHLLGNV